MPKIKYNSHLYDDIPNTIRAYRVIRGIRSDAALADKVGMSRSAFAYRLRHPASIDADLIEKICRVLRIKPSQLWEPVSIGQNCISIEEARA